MDVHKPEAQLARKAQGGAVGEIDPIDLETGSVGVGHAGRQYGAGAGAVNA